MKTLLSALMLSLLTAAPGLALDRNPAQTFATCLGRLSAMMEHQHLMARDARAVTERRAHFVDLYDAVRVTVPSPRELLHLRITAKMDHAQLLQVAEFDADPRRARWAKLRARSLMQSCEGLLLS